MKTKGLVILLGLLVLAIMTSCGPDVKTNLDKVDQTEIDGCQYLVYYTYPVSKAYTHKGNCNNSIHIYNK